MSRFWTHARMVSDVVLEFAKAVSLWVLLVYAIAAMVSVTEIPGKLDALLYQFKDHSGGYANLTDGLTLLRGQLAYDARSLRQVLRQESWKHQLNIGTTCLVGDRSVHVPYMCFTTNSINNEGIWVPAKEN